MSYCSRVYRQRNAHTHDEGIKQPFFSKQHDVNKSQQKNTFFQTKLTVNEPGDVYEREADAVANSLINHSQSNKPVVQQKEISSVQKKDNADEKKDELKNVQKKDATAEDEKKKKTPVQTKHESGATNNASPKVSSAIEQSAGKGNALAANTLHDMSSSFGVDFSNVRVHNDSESATLNDKLNAQAFTHGNDIYFNKGKYNPTNANGKFLLAHELTHVVQQDNEMQSSSENIQRTIGDTRDLSSPRFKGDVELEACFDGEKVFRRGNKGEHIRKIQQALIDAGFPLPQFGADSSFGIETQTAVKGFQQQSGLIASEQDGAIGPITMSRLDSRFTRGSANTVEQRCANGDKTITVDVAMMRGAGGNPAADIAFANTVFAGCCIKFRLGTQINVPDSISDSVLGNDTDLLVGGCGETSAEDLNTFLTVTTLFELSDPIIAFYVNTLHSATTGRLRGNSIAPICATGAAAPMEGMISIANGAGERTFSHEVAHVLMNTFGDHSVNTDNIQHVSEGATGEQISPVQCDIMYTRTV